MFLQVARVSILRTEKENGYLDTIGLHDYRTRGAEETLGLPTDRRNKEGHETKMMIAFSKQMRG